MAASAEKSAEAGAPGNVTEITPEMIQAAWDYFYEQGYEWPGGEHSTEVFFAGLYRRMKHVSLDMKEVV
jgi:hypothetical protein